MTSELKLPDIARTDCVIKDPRDMRNQALMYYSFYFFRHADMLRKTARKARSRKDYVEEAFLMRSAMELETAILSANRDRWGNHDE